MPTRRELTCERCCNRKVDIKKTRRAEFNDLFPFLDQNRRRQMHSDIR
jgi:hypothetical protein